MAEIDGRTVLTFESLETEACRSVSNDLPWNIPLTWLIDVQGVKVMDVVSVNSNLSLPSIEGEKNTQQGWWQQNDGTLVLSIANGHPVNITLNGSDVDNDVLKQAEFFNNHTAAVTVAGHRPRTCSSGQSGSLTTQACDSPGWFSQELPTMWTLGFRTLWWV